MYRPPPTSGRLRAIMDEWNSLVPQASGLPRVRIWTREPATEKQGRERLDWLKAQLLSRASTFGLTFGVEMESLLPAGSYRDGLRDAIRTAGLSAEVESLNHTTRPHWKLTTDGSLGDYVRGVETVSPILLGDDGFNALRTVCDVLTAMNVRISTSCGLHVHVGVKGRDVAFFKRLIKLYATYEPVIDTWMARSRRGDHNSRWCRSIVRFANEPSIDNAVTLDQLGAAYGIDVPMARRGAHGSAKYRKLNLYNVWDRGTVEFRHHQGSVDAVKVENWARLCMRMVLAAAKEDLIIPPLASMAGAVTDEARTQIIAERFNTFMELIGASAEEKAYFAGRVVHFANQDRSRRVRRQRMAV